MFRASLCPSSGEQRTCYCINFCLNMFRASLCPSSGEQRPCYCINYCLNMFRASLCPSSGEQRPCYCIWCIALALLVVVGSGCGALRCRMRGRTSITLRGPCEVSLWRMLLCVTDAVGYYIDTASVIYWQISVEIQCTDADKRKLYCSEEFFSLDTLFVAKPTWPGLDLNLGQKSRRLTAWSRPPPRTIH